MEILIKASLAMLLLFPVSASSSAQPLTLSGSSVRPPECFDGTPHKKTLVRVDERVQLQVLDWGGADKSRTIGAARRLWSTCTLASAPRSRKVFGLESS